MYWPKTASVPVTGPELTIKNAWGGAPERRGMTMLGKTGKLLLAFAAAAVLTAGLAGCGGDKKESGAAAGSDKLIIAINSTFPPFESVKEGTKDYTGVDIDIAEYIAAKMGKTPEFTDMKFASLVPTLQSGRADMILSAISPTEERMKVVDFSIPYYFPMKAIICQKGAGYDSLDKLQGLSAGASMGTTYAKELQEAGGITVVEMDSTPLVVQDIKNGRLAAGLFDSAQAGVFISQNPDLEMHILDLPVVMDDTFAVALPKGSPDVEQVNALLREMKENGTMHDIFVKYLGEEATEQYEALEAGLDITQW